jgi:hypothetical protein
MYGPATENMFWRVRTNTEMRELYKTPPLTGDIKTKRSELLGYIIRMDQTGVTKKIIESNPEGTIEVGRARLGLMKDVQNSR